MKQNDDDDETNILSLSRIMILIYYRMQREKQEKWLDNKGNETKAKKSLMARVINQSLCGFITQSVINKNNACQPVTSRGCGTN